MTGREDELTEDLNDNAPAIYSADELSPPSIRATFPGVVYQLGNLLASYNATLQAAIGERMGHDYSWALAGVAGVVAVVIAIDRLRHGGATRQARSTSTLHS